MATDKAQNEPRGGRQPEWDRLYRAARAAGADEDLAHEAAAAGVHPEMVAGPFSNAIVFLRAANFHGMNAAGLLEQVNGDPEAAWHLWARTSGR